MGVGETGGKTTGGKERGVGETGGKEKGVGETEGKTTGVKERGVGETRAKEWESNKSVNKIKHYRKTSFVKITCQYSDVYLLGFIESSLQTYMSHCSSNSFRILRSSVACACRLNHYAVAVIGRQRPS